ncbi:FtsK/SpoIIIE domain-containing protein [Streptomyces sp. RFCAC02]|uniref:FtsK/SpoIIIE domain-containing protein n=1 Tax=Streptomyces sp. RFCAC02 TaxID=2499143 RepID=UPI00101FD23D|nr:FtsK/SpoIIIE domain-containing protein [Streptomyces sp. RFCAC02]
MRIRLTVFTAGGAPGTAAGVDVSVGAPAGTPLDAVLGALAAAVAPGSAVPGAVFCEDRRIDPRRALLGEPPLVDGAVLAFHRPLEETAPGPVPATLHVVAGPDAGGVHLLRGGEARIGRSARADVPLDDPDVSRAHCALTVGPDGSVTVTDTGSTNGTLLDGRPVTGGPVPVPHGGVLRLGESALRVLVPAGPASGAAPAPGAGAGPADAPDEPGTRRTGRRGLAGWARGRPAAAETAVREIPRFDGAAHDTAAAADEARCPDAAAVLLTALDRGPALWSRGPAHPDTLRVRLGTFHRPSRALPPSAVALTEAGSLGIAGPRERTLGVARSVLAQLAALHPPSTLELVVIAPGHEDDWSWLGWLPHVRPTRGQDCELLLAFDAEQAAARLQELTSPTGPPEPAGGRRTVVLADGDPGGAGARTALARLAAAGPQRGVHLITLADVPPATADSPAGRALAAARALSPVFAACGAAALLSGVVATSVRVTGPDGAAGPPAGVDAVSAAWAERFARALAPVTEESAGRAVPVPAAPGGTVPETCRLLDVLELARVTPGTLRERWTQRPSLTAVLGEGARGPVGVDLAALSGPLAIEGGTGAGRTELLVTLAASLATARSPRDLSLLLVEGTGEGLRPAAELPHVATWLGANDPLRMRAFAQALRAELKRRAALLGDADFTAARGRSGRVVGPRPAGDEALPEPEGPPILARGSDPLPWLVVLVDDFGELLAPALGAPGRQAAGSVVRILDAVVKEGRRLGVRLVTAGGPVPPGGGISVALTGQPAGRGELRRGGGGAGETFQAGRVTGRIPRTATLRPTVARVDWARAGDAPPRRPVRELGNGPTDMALLASAAARAAESDRSTAATLV